VLEYLLYSDGFNGKTLSRALATLIECSDAAVRLEPPSA
jgi:hypothetical protein